MRCDIGSHQLEAAAAGAPSGVHVCRWWSIMLLHGSHVTISPFHGSSPENVQFGRGSDSFFRPGSHSPFLFPVRRVPPRFSIPPTDNEIMPGGSVNITCVAVGSPMPYVKWMLGAEDLTPEDDMPIGRNVLELTDVRQSANYTCVAMSTLGVIEAMAQITVKGKELPPGVRNGAVPEPESI